ncbi:MAG TPA: DUF4238 domain-containing protein [Anaerolineales bacterium]|nr:DUF4238 domain-containing protein [Anaerolineales bacterium]
MAAEHHHYVPQMLLRGFLSKIGTEAGKEQVRVYDLERKESFPTSITNIMGERRFNEWWIDDETLATIEPATSQIEGELAPLVEKIRAEKRLKFTPDNHANLSLLMAFQFIRTKKMRMMPERLNQQIVGHVKKMGFDPSKVQGLVDWDKESLKKYHVKMQIEGLSKYAEIMSDKVFFVMTAPQGESFYLSDHPVTLHSDEKRHGAMRGLGIGVPYIQIYLPLSADVMLCAYDRAVLGNLMRCRDEEMNRGKGMALKMLMDGKITAAQMKGFVEGAKEYDDIGPLIDTIRAGEAVAVTKDQVDCYNSLQVFHAHRFVVDPAGKFDLVEEMMVEREAIAGKEEESSIF